jgi:hypothetical protein
VLGASSILISARPTLHPHPTGHRRLTRLRLPPSAPGGRDQAYRYCAGGSHRHGRRRNSGDCAWPRSVGDLESRRGRRVVRSRSAGVVRSETRCPRTTSICLKSVSIFPADIGSRLLQCRNSAALPSTTRMDYYGHESGTWTTSLRPYRRSVDERVAVLLRTLACHRSVERRRTRRAEFSHARRQTAPTNIGPERIRRRCQKRIQLSTAAINSDRGASCACLQATTLDISSRLSYQ